MSAKVHYLTDRYSQVSRLADADAFKYNDNIIVCIYSFRLIFYPSAKGTDLMNICLFGASSNSLAPVYYSDARELGRLIGKGGHTLIYGGSDCGLMKSCANGVLETNGRILGIAPRFFLEADVLSTYCTDFIYTETMSERKQTMEDNADAFITLPGGIGTYDEFFETLTLKQLRVHNKPVAVLNTADYFMRLIDLLRECAEKGFMHPDCLNLFRLCSTPEEALSYVMSDETANTSGKGLTGYTL